MAEVISLLQLIGAEDVLVVCEEYTDLISNFRDQMVLQRRTPTEDELEEVSAKVNTAIERFYRELSKVYVSIPNA